MTPASIQKQIAALVRENPRQMTGLEYRYIAREIAGRDDCRLLVFGCGLDSVLWVTVNRGHTLFLESERRWVYRGAGMIKTAMAAGLHTSYRMATCDYWTTAGNWREEIGSVCLSLEGESTGELGRTWNVVIVDGPSGDRDYKAGRLQSIFTASQVVLPGGAVFIHDMHRPLERAAADRWMRSFTETRLSRRLSVFREPLEDQANE